MRLSENKETKTTADLAPADVLVKGMTDPESKPTEKKRGKTVYETSEDSEKISKDTPSDSIEDSDKDTEPMETPSQSRKTSVSVVSAQVSDPVVSEKDLRREQEKAKKMMLIRELLESGYSVRDVCSELGVKKTLVEKVSKKLRQETASSGSAKAVYLDKPYRDTLTKMEQAEDEDSLLAGNWLTETYRRLARMRIEFSLMKKMGLIEGGEDGNASTSPRIDINGILIAKALGGNNGNKEIIELIAAFKQMGVLAQPQADNFLEKYSQLEAVKSKSIEDYEKLQSRAMQQVQGQQNRSLIEKAVDGLVPVAKSLITSAAQKVPAPSIPLPQNIEGLEGLRLPLPQAAENIPVGQIIEEGAGVVESLPSTVSDSQVGYTNLMPRPQVKKP
jgi:transposase-like protein